MAADRNERHLFQCRVLPFRISRCFAVVPLLPDGARTRRILLLPIFLLFHLR
jgi:hypothetical protein